MISTCSSSLLIFWWPPGVESVRFFCQEAALNWLSAVENHLGFDVSAAGGVATPTVGLRPAALASTGHLLELQSPSPHLSAVSQILHFSKIPRGSWVHIPV